MVLDERALCTLRTPSPHCDISLDCPGSLNVLVWAFWKNGHTIKEVGKSSVQGGLAAGDPEKGLVVKFKTKEYISAGRIPSVWRRSFSSSIQALS